MENSLFYHKVMPAPMVRISTLSFRLLCAHFGADVVWTEELVSAKLMKCSRRYLPDVFDLVQNQEQLSLRKFLSLLERFNSLLKNGKNENQEEEQQQEGENENEEDEILKVLVRWSKIYPFIPDLLQNGRVEVVYHGHQNQNNQQQQQQNQNQQNQNQQNNNSNSKKKGTAATVVEGEEESKVGEIVFTTLALPRPRLGSSSSFSSFSSSSSIESFTFTLKEHGKPLVGQIGASEGKVAVAGFDLLSPFVCEATLNCGCPKAFSVKNGMGAALMANKDKAAEILGGLHKSFPHHSISYKTRLFEKLEDSMSHLRACYEATEGKLHALTLHARHRPQRSETAPLYSDALEFKKMIRGDPEMGKKLCLVFNGSIGLRTSSSSSSSSVSSTSAVSATTVSSSSNNNKKEIDALFDSDFSGRSKVLDSTVQDLGFDGAMLARASMWRPSVFSDAPPLSPNQIPFPCSSSSQSQNSRNANSSANSNSDSNSSSPLLEFMLREFQSLLIGYCAAGDNMRLFKYHATRAIPEYQNSDLCKGGNNAVLSKDQIAELNKVFCGIRDSKNNNYVEFAKALKFSSAEIGALKWMMEWIEWRRSGGASGSGILLFQNQASEKAKIKTPIFAASASSSSSSSSSSATTAAASSNNTISQQQDEEGEGNENLPNRREREKEGEN